MRDHLCAAAAVILALAAAGAAASQTGPAGFDVRLGPAVQVRAGELGQTDLDEQRQYLRKDILAALSHISQKPLSVSLAIVDIEPNRPTSAQLGASAQLSSSSSGTGGAAITGEIVTADGRHLPVRFRLFADLLRHETQYSTWGDADQAFDALGALIGAGKVPNETTFWPGPHKARALTGTRIPG